MIYKPREDSYLLKKYVEKYSKGKKVIDIGAGSGIQAETALKMGAKKVIASDIDKEAVEYCKKNGINAVVSKSVPPTSIENTPSRPAILLNHIPNAKIIKTKIF